MNISEEIERKLRKEEVLGSHTTKKSPATVQWEKSLGNYRPKSKKEHEQSYWKEK